MASISSEYMIKEGASGDEGANEPESFAYCALVHSIKIDLLPLLMAAKIRMHRLPVVYLEGADT